MLFRKENQSDQWINSETEVNVFDGESNDKETLYDISWNQNEGPLLQVAPGTVKVGKYTADITWNLIDAPV
ncbi:WxL domain-containing protein [Lactococcus formosensis]|uniref:WxL domain-containing protein n=1 Tax=Lactococcus formosensis TaxID=1281486 RepID=UPI00254C6A11|nr:WxL domain-containing protein [Lactococcus formosensis]